MLEHTVAYHFMLYTCMCIDEEPCTPFSWSEVDMKASTQHHFPLSCFPRTALFPSSLRLPLGLQVPVMMPSGVIFHFFSSLQALNKLEIGLITTCEQNSNSLQV